MEKIHTTDFEKNKRVNEVAKAMLNGYSNRKILIQYLTENQDWNVGERTLDNYIKEARELLMLINDNEIELEKSLALNRLDALYTMNYKIMDLRECRNIIESRMTLLGIGAKKIDITTKGEAINISGLSTEELLMRAKAVEQLEQKDESQT